MDPSLPAERPRSKEKVLGRYPELSLKDAREQVRQDRARIERGIDVSAAKQAEKTLVLDVPTVQSLGEVWFARYIQPNPASDLDVMDAGGDESSRDRWLTLEELQQLAKAMQDARSRKPVRGDLRHSVPSHRVTLATPPEAAPPQISDVVMERPECPEIGGHCVVCEVARDHGLQPPSLCGDGIVPALTQLRADPCCLPPR